MALTGMHVVIVFHNKARTDYQVRGPFKTIEEAERYAATVQGHFAPSAVEAIETSALLETSLFGGKR
jgi:hypothetical protein